MSPAGNELPSAFLDRLPAILSAEDEQVFHQFVTQPRSLAVRVTDPACPRSEAVPMLQSAGYSVEEVQWMPEAMRLSPPDRRLIQETPLYREGRVFIQSLSSMAAVQALDVQPGHDVLDCCAAPGGKTSLIRYRQEGRGILVANDTSRRRLQKMRQVLDHIHVKDVELLSQQAETLGGSHADCFDRVLLDVPCSGEGRFHVATPSTWSDWEPGKVRRLARLQKRLLRSALKTLRPGGVLLYATCTMSPEENELVLAEVLADPPLHVSLEPIELPCEGRRPGLSKWGEEGLPNWTRDVIRIMPINGMTPFFLAKLRRH